MSAVMRAPARFEIQLIHIQGSLKGEINTFMEDLITIGRQHTCSVKFPPDEPGVSREHAKIQREGNQFRLIDLSKYGTFVNGKQAGEATFLRSGDVLEFGPGGPKVSFHAEIVAGEAAMVEPAPAAAPEPVRQPQPVRDIVEQQVAAPVITPVIVPPPQPPQQPVVPPPVRMSQPVKTAVPLVIQYGPSIRSYRELPVIIGSDPGADFLLQFPGISGKHLQIFYANGSYWVKDLAAVGVVAVNRQRVEAPVQLKPFDEIECCPGGPVLRFIGEGRLVEVEKEEAAAKWMTDKQQAPAAAENPASQQQEGNFLSKFIKGFKK